MTLRIPLHRNFSESLLLSLAVIGAVVYAAVFFPGAMGFDAAYQWWQARGGATSNIHGVAMTWLWRFGGLFAMGPAPLFILQLALFWLGITLIALSLPVRAIWRAVFVFVTAAAPVCFVLFSCVASDVTFMAALVCAVGLLMMANGSRQRFWALTSLVLIILASLLRKNSAPAIFPLLVYSFFVINHGSRPAWKSLFRSTALAIPAMFIVQAGGLLLEHTVDRQVTIFAATELWDLTALSLSTNSILLPPDSHGAGLTLDDLRSAFVPYANTTIFERTRAGVRQPFFKAEDPINDEIWHAWAAAIIDHPGDYFAHRWQLTRALFGNKDPQWPRELVYFDGEYQYADNPPVASNTSDAHAWWLGLFEAARNTLLMAAWPYIALAVIASAIAWRRRSEKQAQGALATLASGLLYALPLPFISPSAELRYLGWTCLSAIIGAALALSSVKHADSLNTGE